MIRRAIQEDIVHIYEMAEVFNKKYFGIPLYPERALTTIAYIIEEGVCFVSDTGFIGGMVADDLFRDWKILHEAGWYSEDKSGIKLLDAFIQEGRDLGVDEIKVGTLSTSPAMAGRILQRKGFAPLEQSYRLLTGA